MSNESHERDQPVTADGTIVGEVPGGPRPDRVGEVVGPYLLLGLIGEGGMGVVYRAAHTLVDRVVALKVLKPALAANRRAVQRFLQEAQAGVRLRHDNIVTVYDVGRNGDEVYVAMALVEGESLARHVARHGPMPPALALAVAERVARALAYAHARGVVHRDIKPGNILFRPPREVTLLDMGLARLLEAEDGTTAAPPGRGSAPADGRLTASGTLVGTVAYMAPEQARDPRQADARSDLYALGCTLYYLLTGQDAFRGRTLTETLDNHAAGRYRPLREHLPDVPPLVEQVLGMMIAPRPADRFQTASELAKSLVHCIGRHYRHDPGESFLGAPLPSIPGYSLWASPEVIDPAWGDFHGVVPLPGDRFAVLIGGVSGHPGPLQAERVLRVTRDLRRALVNSGDAAEALQEMNRAICGSGRDEWFTTLALCVLDPKTASVALVNAGHCPPLIRRSSGAVSITEAVGYPLGIVEEACYEAVELGLGDGDVVVLYTDYVTEAVGLLDIPTNYGAERLRSRLSELSGNAREVGAGLLTDLQQFCGGPRPPDEASVVVFGRQ
jgi:serine/threonine protein kinase